MVNKDLNGRIIELGQEIFDAIAQNQPTLFDKGHWTGRILDWCMAQEKFKVQMFRFIDVFPALPDNASLMRHLQQYFGSGDELPTVLKWGLRTSGLGGAIAPALLGKAMRSQIESMARQFIIGQTSQEAISGLKRLRHEGYGYVVDVLGEATVSEQEAENYATTYLELLDELISADKKWSALGSGDGLDWGHAPRVNISVKPSAFFSQAQPRDFAGSVNGIVQGMQPVLQKVRAAGGFFCIDMESHVYKDMTLEVYRQLRKAHPDYQHVGVVLQAYLKETDQDLQSLLAWARSENLPISIRLVKGAYWDYETVIAEQNGWRVPVYTSKAETDAAFERLARIILENQDICHFACASHNIRSVAAVLAHAEELQVPQERYEFQVLYGMAEPVRQALLEKVGRVRLYCPYGDLIPGMAYLVRRLLENTSNESFLRKSFAEQVDHASLLADPTKILQENSPPTVTANRDDDRVFCNEPAADFTVEQLRSAFPLAIDRWRKNDCSIVDLWLNGRDVRTEQRIPSVNPADPDETVAFICQASSEDADQAIAAAKAAQPAWAATPVTERASMMRRAADLLHEKIVDYAALQVLEVGKQWEQAYADVTEAIDFLRYYAQQMELLSTPLRCGQMPGEDNRYFYQPRGVAVVIAPWNFPLAISTGMVSAALVTGNTVVYKPSLLSTAIGRILADVFAAVQLPAGVFNFLPGPGKEVGERLVRHPDTSIIAFTGSMQVGLDIMRASTELGPGQAHVKKVIAEMGGKNAIIVDDDADLDQAVPQILASAFGFQGQKCSACSRAIVVDGIYERFVRRLVDAAASLAIGPAEDPRFAMGPVVDKAARDKIMDYVVLARQEAKILYESKLPQGPCYVPLVILEGVPPDHRLAQDEIFGPVLTLLRAKDFSTALDWANNSKFALTGGVFSRSPANLALARDAFRVGNLYLNRGITGALVDRQPFGGFRLSGIGSKAGGPDYLKQFMEPRVVTENTMRRGFAAEIVD